MVAQVPASGLPFEDGDVRDRDSASPELYGKRRVHLGGIAIHPFRANLRDFELGYVAKNELHAIECALHVRRRCARTAVGAQAVVKRLDVASVNGIDDGVQCRCGIGMVSAAIVAAVIATPAGGRQNDGQRYG